MRRLLKWIFRLVFAGVALVVVLALCKDMILRGLAERRIRAQTGMDAKIGRFSVSLLSPVMTLEDLRLYNTAAFGGGPLLHVRELHVEYDRVALAQRQLRLTLLRLDLAELNLVRNEAGQTNLTSLLGQAAVPPPGGRAGAPRVGDLEFTGVDVLNLSLGRMRYVDLQDPSHNRETDLNVRDLVLKNVKSEGDLMGVAVMVWLRAGGLMSGVPMPSPPQIIPGPIPSAPRQP